MLAYIDLYSTDFAKFQQECRNDLKRVVKDVPDLDTWLSSQQINLKVNGLARKVKYSGACRFNQLFQIASRGTTWFVDSNRWYFTMPKFPNLSQSKNFFGVSEMQVLENLQSQGYTLAVMPKWDGSAIHIFRHEGQTHAYTLGSLNTNLKMQGSIEKSPTFGELAIQLLREQYPDAEAWLDSRPGTGLMFELCSRWNRIVTRYDHLGLGRLHPLVIVRADGSLSWDWPSDMKRDHIAWSLADYSREALNEHLAKLLTNTSIYGINPEGLVIYAVSAPGERDSGANECDVTPLFKVKRPEYLAVHQTVCLEFGTVADFNKVGEAYLQEIYDDWNHPSEEAKLVRDGYRDELESCLIDVSGRLESQLVELANLDNKKEFAQALQRLRLPAWLTSAFYDIHKQKELAKLVENPALELIKNILLEVLKEGGTTRLAGLQKKSCYWFKI